MPAMPQRVPGLLLACAAGLAVSVGAAANDNYDAIKLRVPVKLKNMLPQARYASVKCEIRDGNAHQLGEEWALRAIQTVNFDDVLEIVVNPKAGKTFFEAKSYSCFFYLSQQKNTGMLPPLQGTPPKTDLFRYGKPDEYFMQAFTGPLDGGKFNPGIAGSKDLTIGPKQKQ